MITIKRTNKRNIPFFYILGKQFRPFNIEYNLRILQFNKLVERYFSNYVLLKDGWILNYNSAELMAREYPEWKYYLPPFSLNDKVVLDIGAGCGETARYYLLNGAKRVICIDNDDDCIKVLECNSSNFNIYVIGESFNLEHLSLDYDVCKIDIEGYEALLINGVDNGLIDVKKLKPMIIETHSIYCINRLKDMDFNIIYSYRDDLKLMSNWRARHSTCRSYIF